MSVRAELRPKGPYSLRVSGRMASDATRVVVDGTYRATIRVDDRLERVQALQRADGTIVVAAESDEGVDHVRFALGLDDDHSEFVRRFANDPLLAETLRHVRGLRPVRTATVAQIERTVIRHATPELDGLHAAPTCDDLARFSPAQLGALGLGARRASALIRLCRTLDLEKLKTNPTEAVALRLERERGLGPWSVGVVCIEGLGRYERGLAHDLGLVKLAAALWLASVYLLAGFGRGLIPLPRDRAAA